LADRVARFFWLEKAFFKNKFGFFILKISRFLKTHRISLPFALLMV